MSCKSRAAGFHHSSVESSAGSPLGEMRLSDRGRVSVILQGACLLAHLEAMSWRLESRWEDLYLDGSGVLRGARVIAGSDQEHAASRLSCLIELLFEVQDHLAGKGQARRWAAAALARWRRVQGSRPAGRIVTEILDEVDFLWNPVFAEGRRALIAEIDSPGGPRLVVAGRGAFELILLAQGASRLQLEEAVRDASAGEIWERCRKKAWRGTESETIPVSDPSRDPSSSQCQWPREAMLHHRRSLSRSEAAGHWRDLVWARLEQGDLSGAYRAGRHALRLLESVDSVAAEVVSIQLVDLRLRWGDRQAMTRLEGTGVMQIAPATDRREPTFQEMIVRRDLVRGRPDEALRKGRAALAAIDQRQASTRRRLEILIARALGWLGRGADARELLEELSGPVCHTLEPEEIPALWGLAGDWQRARECAPDKGAGSLWRRLLAGAPVDPSSWRTVSSLGPYRMARLVFDVQLLCPGSVPAKWLARSAEVLRRVEAFSFAERLEATQLGPWRALESFLSHSGEADRDFERLFCEAGYFDARLEWRHHKGTQVLIAGRGGAQRLTAAKHGGELSLAAESLDAVAKTLFALTVRNFEPAVVSPAPQRTRVRGILGESKSLRDALDRLDRLADSDIPILVQGESGTGKELAARQLHHLSPRSSQPLVPINCAALSESLLLADLFGHVRGAFTGADRDRAGVFESARGGSVLLDEIGDLPLAAQGKLLRVLQEGEVRRVGESRPRSIDVRIIAATHRDLRAMVEREAFREDLFYRLKVGSLTLPPLRDRERDVHLLADHFVERSGYRLTARARRALLRHSWPGNVRELRNVLQVAMALGRGQWIDLPDLEIPTDATGKLLGYHQQVDELRRTLIREALTASQGQRAAAARRLGVSRQAMTYLMRRFGLS